MSQISNIMPQKAFARAVIGICVTECSKPDKYIKVYTVLLQLITRFFIQRSCYYLANDS